MRACYPGTRTRAFPRVQPGTRLRLKRQSLARRYSATLVRRCASTILSHPSQLSLEFLGINPVLEHFCSVDEDHRNVVAVSLAKQRVVVDVDFFQYEFFVTAR